MESITNNEMLVVLSIFKSPEKSYNANNLSKHLNISSMGALKIVKRLEKEGILFSKKIGKANIYKINFKNDYSIDYLKFAIKREARQAHPYVRRWLTEIKSLTNAKGAILFGSVLRKFKEANDIDVLLLTDKKGFSNLKKQIEKSNNFNLKRIHPVYQTEEDFNKNIREEDKVVLNAIKGIYAFGEDLFIKILEK